jgi:hypothetical protein
VMIGKSTIKMITRPRRRRSHLRFIFMGQNLR